MNFGYGSIVTGGLVGNPILSKFTLGFVSVSVVSRRRKKAPAGKLPHHEDDQEYFVTIKIRINKKDKIVQTYKTDKKTATVIVKYIKLINKSIETVVNAFINRTNSIVKILGWNNTK